MRIKNWLIPCSCILVGALAIPAAHAGVIRKTGREIASGSKVVAHDTTHGADAVGKRAHGPLAVVVPGTTRAAKDVWKFLW
jgi:hypothetical protein